MIKREESSHKGENGKVLVIGGSEDYIGAVALAGIAALRAGADIVVVAAPSKVGWAVNSLYADLIVKKVKGKYFMKSHVKELLKLSKDFDCVLIGNGIGMKSKNFCSQFIKKVKKPCIIDADAIKAVDIKIVDNCILTPHAKEMDIFLANSGYKGLKNLDKIQKIIKNNVILLKGAVDYIISKDELKTNKTGNAGMTKGGTGDVLAGLCAGFYAQTKDLFGSALTAAEVSGKIGDVLLKKKKGYYYLASDMIEEIKRFL